MEADPMTEAKAVMAIVVDGGSQEDVHRSALAAKRRLSNKNYELWKAVQLIDSVVFNYCSDPNWAYGFLPADQAVATVQAAQEGQGQAALSSTSARGARVLAIARAMLNEGAKTVTARKIAEQLKRQGDETPEKDLATAAGNILARTQGLWRRVRPGEYEPVPEKGEDVG